MNHEKLRCYGQLVGITERLSKLIDHWPRGYGYLADQLRRAMTSSILNLAEGNGKHSKPERRRFFEISLGSIAEVSACLDLCFSFSLLKPLEIREFKETLNHSYWQIKKLP